MGLITEFAKEAGKAYISERGVVGTVEDAGTLIQGIGKLAKKGVDLFTSDDDNYEVDDEEVYEQESNSFDQETWDRLWNKVEEAKKEGDYDDALKILSNFYNRYEVARDFAYSYLKADILIAQYRDYEERPKEKDISLEAKIGNAILSCKSSDMDEDERKWTKELEEDFKAAKKFVAFARDVDKTFDLIEKRRDPDHIITTSKVNDTLDAFRLLDDFTDKHNTAEGFYYFQRANIYNALFAALTQRKDELQALSDSQLEEFFDDAKRSTERAYKAAEDDEDKSQEEFLVKRIPEQIEMIRALRQGGSAPATQAATEASDGEREYLEEVKACLADDGQITDRERRLLDRLRQSLGISEERAAELEASLSALADNEREYLDEVKACLADDGQITARERRLLDRLRQSLGISEERAAEIERSL